MKTSEVFGISAEVSNYSYIDRSQKDEELKKFLKRDRHIAIKGESKSGKTWIRRKNIPNSIVVQCRYGKSFIDIYKDALSQLGINLIVSSHESGSFSGSVQATTEFGKSLLMKLGVTAKLESSKNRSINFEPVGRDINDLKFIADVIINSGRRLVIEDFHYLSERERKFFAFDLKALWDYKCFVVVIGIWTQSNYLYYLNPDLTGRIHEISIYWNIDDLRKVVIKGCENLNIQFSKKIINDFVSYSYQNVGILQNLILNTLDCMGIDEKAVKKTSLDDQKKYIDASMEYAEQLSPYFTKFADTVSEGIRKKKNSTGIYAHAMAVITSVEDRELINGLSVDDIFEIAYKRQPRIQKSNLKIVLQKIEEIQVDNEGRGLIIAYNKAEEKVFIVDRQLLFYRLYKTIKWPWEALISEAKDNSYDEEES
jgi:hypothetical protein